MFTKPKYDVYDPCDMGHVIESVQVQFPHIQNKFNVNDHCDASVTQPSDSINCVKNNLSNKFCIQLGFSESYGNTIFFL